MKPHTLQELDAVALRRDLPEHGLKTGDAGTILHAYRDGEGFEVEFLDGDGKTTLGVVTLRPEDLDPASNAEELRRQHLRRGIEMTPAERLRWLEETMAKIWTRVARAGELREIRERCSRLPSTLAHRS